jgi:hypothetical protein
MRLKVERISKALAQGLSGLAEVECVTLGEAAEADILDPYFTLVLDVYYRGSAPALARRRKIYGDPTPFETAIHQAKDRFFIESLPVHVEYRDVDRVDQLVRGRDALASAIRETGTHPFYRLRECQVLFSRGGWIDSAREAIQDLPPDFWKGLVAAFSAKMEHYLADLGASVMRADDFYSVVSLSEFLTSTVSTLFALNMRFEPAYRFTMRELPGLALLPDDFMGCWENLVRHEDQLTQARKYEIAKLLAKNIFALIH